MEKKKIFEKISQYLIDHKGISELILTEEAHIADYGFTKEEWLRMCCDWCEMFGLSKQFWPLPQGRLQALIDFIYDEKCKIEIVKIWKSLSVYMTADGQFWDFRYRDDVLEVRKRLPDKENAFFEVYLLPDSLYVYSKRRKCFAKVFEQAKEKFGGLVLFDDFFLNGKLWDDFGTFDAKSLKLYNEKGEAVLPVEFLQAMTGVRMITYGNGYLKVEVSGCAAPWYFHLENDGCVSISEEEFAAGFKPNSQPSYGWSFPCEVIRKQLP